MGLLAAIRRRQRHQVHFRVSVFGLGQAQYPCFDQLADAQEYADRVARGLGATCVVAAVVKDEQVGDSIYTAYPPEGESDGGSSGVREPRRPYPGPSAGSVSLDLPE